MPRKGKLILKNSMFKLVRSMRKEVSSLMLLEFRESVVTLLGSQRTEKSKMSGKREESPGYKTSGSPYWLG